MTVRTNWLPALLSACAAAAVAMVLQNLVRQVWQIRTLPERVMEWLLLFVPLDLFERGLAQFGADAKQVALTMTTIGMFVVLVAVGALALRAGWHSWLLLALGAGLWFISMAVVMPITGAGFFATQLLIAPLLINAGFLLVFLAYATVLVAGRVFFSARPDTRRRAALLVERRALIAGLVGTLFSAGAARFLGASGGLVGSDLPLAAAPTRAPTPRPTQAAARPTAPAATAANPTPTTAPTVAVVATPTEEPLPNPPPPKKLARDSEGSLTAAGRPRGELAPPITSNDDFYVVTKNAVQDPIVDAESWRLVIDGEVNRPVQVDYRTLRALPAVELVKTLECISNFTAGCNLTSFGCDLISTARWKGVRLSDVFELAGGLKQTAVGLAFLSSDEFTAGLPVSVVDDPETLIVYEMNGEPLPRVHGFPARLLVPGRYGMKNPKWLAGIRATPQEYAGWYEQRGWNKDGIVKTMGRIDVPADGSKLPAGEQRVAGIAYAGDRGVRKVDISTDGGGTWEPMRFLEAMPGKDAMVRWEGTFMLPAGATLTLTVRATDGTGQEQTEEFQLPQPDGGSGRDEVTVSAA